MLARYNTWGGFYGGFSLGWNRGDGAAVTLPQVTARQPGFDGDSFRGPTFSTAQNRLNTQLQRCLNGNCDIAGGAHFAVPELGSFSRERERGGAVITLNAGYNWQFGGFVLGLEADLSTMNRRHDSALAGAGTTNYQFVYDPLSIFRTDINGDYAVTSHLVTRARMRWLTTARLRAGFLAGDCLVYATGGLAAGRSNISVAGMVGETFVEQSRYGIDDPLHTSYSADSKTTWRVSRNSGAEFGWALGGGVEWMTGKGFSLKAEYLYYDLGDQTILAAGATTSTINGRVQPAMTAAPIRIRQDLNGHIVRVGLNFGFSAAPAPVAPVVAAY
jgi:opacity protein-like surface antigen